MVIGRRQWAAVVLTGVAVLAAGLSVPLYYVTMMGLGMSPTRPRVDLSWACLLWSAPLMCIGASVGVLLIQRPIRIWHWCVVVPLILISGAEALWTLSIVL
jgi:hypothetical protein